MIISKTAASRSRVSTLTIQRGQLRAVTINSERVRQTSKVATSDEYEFKFAKMLT